MNSDKMNNAMLLDENRFKLAKGMAQMPGGPENNNPDPVVQSAGTEIKAASIYNDYSQNYQQMGTAMVNPDRVPPSMQPALVQQPQPSANAGDPMEGMRLAANAQNKGLMAHPFLGMDGAKSLIPGALAPDLPGNVPFLQASSSIDNGGMVPGSSTTKINKKGKRTA